MKVALLALLVAAVLAGCGGSDEPDAVGGCTIEPGAQCSGADLTGADLDGADLSAADLSDANLTDANLHGANLSSSNLSGSQIVDADLSDADLSRANLADATITGTDLDGTIFCGTTRTDGTIDDSTCPVTSETVTATDSDAQVTSFDVSGLLCDGATSGSVSVSWETENATAIKLALDTAVPTDFPPSGSTSVTVPCDGAPHAITITPQSDAGPGVPKTEQVSSG